MEIPCGLRNKNKFKHMKYKCLSRNKKILFLSSLTRKVVGQFIQQRFLWYLILCCNFGFAGVLFRSDKETSWIRVNQLGYTEKSIKVAVFVTKSTDKPSRFELIEINSSKIVFTGTRITEHEDMQHLPMFFDLIFLNLVCREGTM